MKMIDLTPEDVVAAENLYPFGALRDSITRGKSNIYGALGEVVFSKSYSKEGWFHDSAPDHDFRHSTFGTVDVKTKRTTATPRGYWNCSIAATSLHQRCDFYFFIRVHESLTTAWILGWMPRTEFFERGSFRRKGELDETSGHGWKYAADCWNLRVDQLRPLR